MPRKGLRSSPTRLEIVQAGSGKWFIYDHGKRQVAGVFDSRIQAKDALAIIKSKGRYARRKTIQHSENPGRGRAFYFLGSATSKIAAMKIERKHPGSFIHEKDGRYYILKSKRIGARANPGVPIYGQVLRIEAKKTHPHTYGGKETKAGQKYFHDFTTKNAMIYGLPDGSLLIKSKK